MICPLFILVMIISMMGPALVLAETPDVPAELPVSHWSYSAVRSLAGTPLLRTGELSFDENSTITRYEMALLVGKILNRLEKLGGAPRNETGDPGTILEQLFEQARRSMDSPDALNNGHLETIRRLIEGFDSELETLGLAERFLPSKSSTELIISDFRSTEATESLPSSPQEEDFFSLKERDKYLVGDNVVRLNDRMEIGATVVARPNSSSNVEASNGIGAIGGSVQVTPGIKVSGEYAGNVGKNGSSPAAVNWGALWQLSEVELGAKYRSVQPGFDPLLDAALPEQGGTRGYDFTVRVGDVLIRTSRDTVESLAEELKELQVVHSLGISYGIGEDTVIRADYSYTDVPMQEAKRRAAIGVGVDTPKGSLEFGLKYEDEADLETTKLGKRGASAGVKYPVPWAEETILQADLAVEEEEGQSTTTSLSLGFVFQKDASILVGYKMIDFNGAMENGEETESGSSNVATAEFSIRF